jgi:hypothetical protein
MINDEKIFLYNVGMKETSIDEWLTKTIFALRFWYGRMVYHADP